ncbi:MAG: recombination protein O N-terminal domain-containing protein [Bacilli bacterium]|nr:recombination protein O N-terminal domain-containing protein [Bacilli bacterium]
MVREFEGIVIKFSKYLDNDAMVTVLTKTGIKSFLARGALKIKSKNARSLNLYTISKFELLEEKYGNILKTSVSIYAPFNLYSSFESLACLSLIGEATFNSINEYDEYDLFNPFSIAIKSMDNNEDPLILAIEYLLLLMSFSGEGIDFNKFTIDEFNKNKLQNIYCNRTYDMDITFSKEEKIYLIKALIEQFESAKGINLKSKEPFYIL